MMNSNLLEEITISENVGLDNVDIKHELIILRKGDDPYDRDIWSRPIQLPDWLKIKNLCIKTLITSRDLNIAARLSESLVHLYDIDGLSQSITIINKIVQGNYLPVDNENREIIFEWIDKKLINSFYEGKLYNMISNNMYIHNSEELLEKLDNIIHNITLLPFYTECLQKSVFKIKNQLISINNLNNALNKNIHNQGVINNHEEGKESSSVLQQLQELIETDPEKLSEILKIMKEKCK